MCLLILCLFEPHLPTVKFWQQKLIDKLYGMLKINRNKYIFKNLIKYLITIHFLQNNIALWITFFKKLIKSHEIWKSIRNNLIIWTSIWLSSNVVVVIIVVFNGFDIFSPWIYLYGVYEDDNGTYSGQKAIMIHFVVVVVCTLTINMNSTAIKFILHYDLYCYFIIFSFDVTIKFLFIF